MMSVKDANATVERETVTVESVYLFICSGYRMSSSLVWRLPPKDVCIDELADALATIGVKVKRYRDSDGALFLEASYEPDGNFAAMFRVHAHMRFGPCLTASVSFTSDSFDESKWHDVAKHINAIGLELESDYVSDISGCKFLHLRLSAR